jgi:dihydrolipoamide dehydrogenase
MDVAKMQSRKESIVTKMTKGVEFLFKKNKIAWLQGFGKFVSGGDTYTIEVGKETVQAKYVIVATGSKARHLPNVTVDNETSATTRARSPFPRRPSASA